MVKILLLFFVTVDHTSTLSADLMHFKCENLIHFYSSNSAKQ